MTDEKDMEAVVSKLDSRVFLTESRIKFGRYVINAPRPGIAEVSAAQFLRVVSEPDPAPPPKTRLAHFIDSLKYVAEDPDLSDADFRKLILELSND